MINKRDLSLFSHYGCIIVVIGLFDLGLTGCRGPEGPAGINAEGVDIQPPTIELKEPWPLSKVWDHLTISAAAVDNVAINRVVFFFDGSSIAGLTALTALNPPYQFVIDSTNLTRGWHFVGARAYDIAGNYADAPPRPVWVGFTRDLSDTTVFTFYHNNIADMIWTVPDSVRTEALWLRLTPAKTCSLRAVTVWLGGVFSDTAEVRVGIWSGTAVPTTEKITSTKSGSELTGLVRPQRFSFSGRATHISNDIYVVVNIGRQSANDTLKVAADDGAPYWGRSGSRDEAGWHTLRERFGRRNNLLIMAELYYARVDSG
ncbi:MAG: hypothetical protein FJY65_07645 [Calditrichaeota bacterium]|nr:hypothetical protein [Calditrichota bacterium]